MAVCRAPQSAGYRDPVQALPAARREDAAVCIRLCTAKLSILCRCCMHVFSEPQEVSSACKVTQKHSAAGFEEYSSCEVKLPG